MKFFRIAFICIGLAATQIGCSDKNAQSETSAKKSDGTHYHILGTSKEANEAISKNLNSNLDVWSLVNQGTSLYENKQYSESINKLLEALRHPNLRHPQEWVARSVLSSAYEESGQYQLALNEIEWLINQRPRQEVVDELNARKQALGRLGEKVSSNQ